MLTPYHVGLPERWSCRGRVPALGHPVRAEYSGCASDAHCCETALVLTVSAVRVQVRGCAFARACPEIRLRACSWCVCWRSCARALTTVCACSCHHLRACACAYAYTRVGAHVWHTNAHMRVCVRAVGEWVGEVRCMGPGVVVPLAVQNEYTIPAHKFVLSAPHLCA